MTPETNGNFHVRTLLTAKDLQTEFADTVKWAKRIWMAYAWARGEESAAHLKALDTSKLVRIALGVDFCQTDPAVIRKLRETGKLRVIKIPNSTFHPKLVVAEGKDGWRALVGSSNLTGGGFGRNREVNVLIHHPGHSEVHALVKFIDEHWEGVFAKEPTDEWLAEYERAYASRPKPVTVPKFDRRVVPLPAEFRDLNVGWPEYLELIKGQEVRLHEYDTSIRILPGDGDSYVKEIEACQFVFQTHLTGRFQQIDDDDRKLIAGWPNFSSGYLGRMGGAGDYKKITGSRPELVGEILDSLPLDGDVSLDLATEVVQGLWKIDGFAAGAVSRLLAVKRPDLFVPANNASFERQKLFFGKKPDNAKKYLEMTARIWTMPWFKAREPSGGLELRIWHARVALLDALFYVPTESKRK